MRAAPTIAPLMLAMLVAGCAPLNAYVYVPAAGASAQASGYPAAYYSLGTGAVRVASFGVFDVSASAASMPVLHVRLLVANNADATPWTLDTRSIVAVLASGRAQAAFVNSDAGTPPLLEIVAGDERVIDLYFALDGASEGPLAFDVLWQVQTPSHAVTERTPFEREALAPRYPSQYAYGYPPPYGYGYTLGGGPYWWYGPQYSGFHDAVFAGHHGFHGGYHYGGHGFGSHGYGGMHGMMP